LGKKFTAFIGSEDSSVFPQGLAADPYPELNGSSPFIPTISEIQTLMLLD
jgi:hypothetical protein